MRRPNETGERLFCLFLLGGHEGTGGVGDQMQFQSAPFNTVTEAVELFEHLKR